jgi:hypothetical protein
LLHPRPGFINEPAQGVLTKKVLKFEYYESKQSDVWKNVGDISRAAGVKDAAVGLYDFPELIETLHSLAFVIKDFCIISGSQSYVPQFSMPNTGAYARHLEKRQSNTAVSKHTKMKNESKHHKTISKGPWTMARSSRMLCARR